MEKLSGCILTSNGWVRGTVEFTEAVAQVSGEPVETPTAPYIIPGFVDLHVHGGNGHDMMGGAADIDAAAAFHARHGTTSLLATSVTAPTDEIDQFLRHVNALSQELRPNRARILGAHLEGPFINPDKLGAQPPAAVPADLELAKAWVELAPVKVMTLAPEADEGGKVAEFLQSRGVKVQIGHSLCCYAHAVAMLQNGAGVTHLFNAMTGVSHRDNGIAGAALAYADYAEIIPDLIHVEEGAILAARRAIPNLYGVTDATAGAGMPDGPFKLGSHTAHKKGDKITLPDGTLAGSVLTMDQAFRNLVRIGLSLAEASHRLSTIPANWIGESKIGRIEAGAHADFVVLGNDLEINASYVSGQEIEKA